MTLLIVKLRKKLYAIDFGYNELSEEFQQLPEGFRFRLTDPVFGYNYEAIKKNNLWNYTYGNLHFQLSGGKGVVIARGPCVSFDTPGTSSRILLPRSIYRNTLA